jgi:hypothetical protein
MLVDNVSDMSIASLPRRSAQGRPQMVFAAPRYGRRIVTGFVVAVIYTSAFDKIS